MFITDFVRKFSTSNFIQSITSSPYEKTELEECKVEVLRKSDCSVCPEAQFQDLNQLRSHFKSEWHIYNVKARQISRICLTESEFLSRESSLAEEESSDSSEDELGTIVGSPFIRFFSSTDEKHYYEVYKCLILEQSELKQRNPIFLDGDLIKKQLLHIAQSKWLILLIRSDRVVLALFDNHNNQMAISKTFRRYTTRKKQGGSQSARDSSGTGRIKSAGAFIRRKNELLLVEDVQKTLEDWRKNIDECSLIFWNPTTTGRNCLSQSVVQIDDSRLRSIPFTTYKPSLEEVQRCYRLLCTIIIKGRFVVMTHEHLFVQFQSVDGTLSGAPLSVPSDSIISQLDTLLNQLLNTEEPLTYSYSVNDLEIISSLKEIILFDPKRAAKEGVITIVYQPQAVFRVQAVSRCSSTLAGHEDVILCVGFSPNGHRLATGSGDKTVRFWDLMTETPLKSGQGHDGWVLCLAWSPDGKYLASGGMEGVICIWDGDRGTLLGRLTGHRKWITQLTWEPLHLCSPCINLASSSKDGTVKVWDVARRTCKLTLSQHTDAVTSVRWGGDGTIYSASRDRTIKMWSSDGRLKGQLTGHAHWINTLGLSTDQVLRTGAYNHKGEIENKSIEFQACAKYRYEAALGSGEKLVSGSDDFTMYLWDPTNTNKPIARLTGHQAAVNHVAFSPDGRWLASASFDKSVKLWNARTGAFVASLRGHVGRVYQISWSADSRLLMSSSQDSTLKIWDSRTRTLKEDLPGHFDEVYAVDWSPNGLRAASGGKDKLLKIWRQ